MKKATIWAAVIVGLCTVMGAAIQKYVWSPRPQPQNIAIAGMVQPHSFSLERTKGNSKNSPPSGPKTGVAVQPGLSIVFKDQIPEVFTIELYKGSRALISRGDLTEKGWGPFSMGDERPFSIYLENGNLYAEAKIYNGPGMPAVEVKKGNFVVRPTDWDRNFSDNALEIVNEKL